MKKLALLLLLFYPILLRAQWQECATPFHGTVLELETFDNYVWAGTKDGGVYRTTNSSASWQAMNNGLPSSFDKQVQDLNVINGELYVSTKGGLYKRSSANANWVQLLNFFNSVGKITGYGNLIIAGQFGNVKRSIDNGATWQNSNTGLPTGGYYADEVTSNPLTGEILLRVDYDLYRSTNLGLSWSLIPSPGSVATMLKRVNDTIYLGTEAGSLYSWDPNNAAWNLLGYGGSRIIDMVMANNQYFVTSSGGVFYVPFSGGNANFQLAFANYPSFFPNVLALEKSNDLIYVGCQTEAMYTLDTLQIAYAIKNIGIKSSPIQFLSGNGNFLLTHGYLQHFTWRSNDEFNTSQISPNGYFQYDDITDDYSENQRWYFLANGLGVQYSSNQGQSFRNANTGLPPSTFLTYNVTSIAKSSLGYLILGSRDGLFYKSNSDTSWALLGSLNSQYENIVKIINTGSYLFAATIDQQSNASAHIYRSADNGQTWQLLPGPFQNGLDVYGFTYDGTRLIAGTNGYGTFSSSDFGQTWTTINSGFTSVQVFKKLKSFNSDVYATSALDQYLYRLPHNDSTWQIINGNPGDPIAAEVFVQNNTLFLGSLNSGIWKLLNYITSIKENSEITSVLFPNPSSTCKLELTNDYTLPLVVTIFDLQGKVVYSDIVNDNRKELQLDATLFNKGIYTVNFKDKNNKSGSRKWSVQ